MDHLRRLYTGLLNNKGTVGLFLLSCLLLLWGLSPYFPGVLGRPFIVVFVVFGVWFLWWVYKIAPDPEVEPKAEPEATSGND